ncbi:MAG TPA: hypothetical protein ENJ09_01690 [Planctomycetes bacterium]|nr:hypothetical protein [Planctomycetota bacterium]
MKYAKTLFGISLATGMTALTLAAATPDPSFDRAEFDVTITNVTRGQIFSPVLVASHSSDTSVFTPGEAASAELAALAEEGNNMPLAMRLSQDANVADVESGSGVILPGTSETIRITVTGKADRISLAGMLVNTNDAFVGLDSFQITRDPETTVRALAYDAGTEFNSESCAFVPGPACGASGAHDPTPAEGYVYVSNGVQGIGDLSPELYDWRNPAAIITIRRVRAGT